LLLNELDVKIRYQLLHEQKEKRKKRAAFAKAWPAAFKPKALITSKFFVESMSILNA